MRGRVVVVAGLVAALLVCATNPADADELPSLGQESTPAEWDAVAQALAEHIEQAGRHRWAGVDRTAAPGSVFAGRLDIEALLERTCWCGSAAESSAGRA